MSVQSQSSEPKALEDLLPGLPLSLRAEVRKDAGFSIQPLSPSIGAEIGGIDLGQPLKDSQKTKLYQALLDWKVLFFREQDITTGEHVAFARQFGTLEVHPFAMPHDDFPEIIVIRHDRESRGKENAWHSDVTWRLKPSLGSILRARQIPESGGDTLFSDMYAAYEGLSDEVKHRIDGLTAIHDFALFRLRLIKQGASRKEIEDFNRQYPKAEHPVVRTHPDTGRKGIYVNVGFTQGIKGMKDSEAKPLLEHLYRQASIPEYQCRFRWRVNSLAFWDNRSTQHYAVSDYWPQVRVMERATIEGDRPV